MNTRKKRLVASTLIAGALSLGTAGLTSLGVGAASADVLGPYPCNPQFIAGCTNPYLGPTLPGPYYP